MGGLTGSSSSTESTQPYIVSGPTVQAANAAAQAQIQASQQASQIATQNDQSAIQAMMGQYSTSLQYMNPIINTGNQAAAQMNYMMGLPAVNPGAAPTAPTAPTINQADINSYLSGNVSLNTDSNKTAAFHPEYTGAVPSDVTYGQYGSGISGLQSVMENGQNTGLIYADGSTVPAVGGAAAYNVPAGIYASLNPNTNLNTYENNPTIDQWATKAMQADPSSSTLYQDQLNTYNNQQTQYQQQQAQYNTNLNNYNNYASKGTATSSDISDIVNNLPGFQFTQQQGLNSIQNAASASGNLNSGNILEQLNQYGQGLSEQYFGNYMNQLGTLAGAGASASNQAATGANALGSNIANEYTTLGNTQANAQLAAGQAMASSYLSPAANQSVNMFPYTTSSSTSSQGSGLSSASQGLGLLTSLGGLFCSKVLKEDYTSISTQDILEKVRALNIEKWKYKGIEQEHIGPYAEQFKDLFGVGDGKTINLIDLFGVMLGSIKELSLEIKHLKGIK
jgi:hypothetical protein